jgi:hypothetical protein
VGGALAGFHERVGVVHGVHQAAERKRGVHVLNTRSLNARADGSPFVRSRRY